MDMFVYGITKDNKISLSETSTLNLDVKGIQTVNTVDIELIKDFIGDHLNSGQIDYEELHNFCLQFLICDNTENYKLIKQLLEPL